MEWSHGTKIKKEMRESTFYFWVQYLSEDLGFGDNLHTCTFVINPIWFKLYSRLASYLPSHSPSLWTHRQTTFPASFAVSFGHVTKPWPTEYEEAIFPTFKVGNKTLPHDSSLAIFAHKPPRYQHQGQRRKPHFEDVRESLLSLSSWKNAWSRCPTLTKFTL